MYKVGVCCNIRVVYSLNPLLQELLSVSIKFSNMQPSTTADGTTVISLSRLRCQALPPPPHHSGPNQSTEPNMDTNDWRGQLQPESRQRIVNKIMDTLKRHLSNCGQEGLHELQKIAERFEEKIFTVATSQTDYLRKIALKMLTMETNSQGARQ